MVLVNAIVCRLHDYEDFNGRRCPTCAEIGRIEKRLEKQGVTTVQPTNVQMANAFPQQVIDLLEAVRPTRARTILTVDESIRIAEAFIRLDTLVRNHNHETG